MHFAPPTPSLDLPCAVPNFMEKPAVTAQPAYPVYSTYGESQPGGGGGWVGGQLQYEKAWMRVFLGV